MGRKCYKTWGSVDLFRASTAEIKKRYGFIYVRHDKEGKGAFKNHTENYL